jgi:hypothetical protein
LQFCAQWLLTLPRNALKNVVLRPHVSEDLCAIRWCQLETTAVIPFLLILIQISGDRRVIEIDKATRREESSPLDEAVFMAAHDEQVGMDLLRGVTDDVARVPALHQRLHAHLQSPSSGGSAPNATESV